MTTHPSDWRNAPPRSKWLALAALLGILGGIVLVTIFSGAAAKAVGPTLIARNAAGELLLANSSALFVIDADEASSTRVPVEELDLRGPVMSVASDGTDWFIGDDATGMLYRCEVAARKCAAALQSRGDRRIFRRAHRVAFGKDRIFLTDSEAHSLQEFDRQGHRLATTRTGPLALCFPNGIVAVGDDLYIADTNNFRIARLRVDDPMRNVTFLQVNAGAALKRANCTNKSGVLGERGTPVLNTVIDSANTTRRTARPPARADRVWPASLLHTSTGEWWVIQMANRMRMGDVIRYAADGHALGRIDLPPEADPIELVEAGGSVLITDMGLMRVHRVTLQGRLAGEWGPPDFLESLRGIRADHERNRRLQYGSVGVIAAGVLAALLVVVFELRRQRSQGWVTRGTLGPVTLAPGALGAETLWIGLEADVQRRLNRLGWMLAAYLLSLIVVFSYLARDLDLATPMGRFRATLFGLFLGLVLLIAGLMLVNILRLPRRRLGISRHEVRFEPGSGNVIAATWDDVCVGARSMLLGRHLVQIIDPRGRYLYSQKLIEEQLLSRLPPSAFLRGARLTIVALRRGNLATWAAVLAFASYFAFMLVKVYRPDLTQDIAVQIFGWFR